MRTIASSLILSATSYVLKSLLLTTKSVQVEGLPILLEALREPVPSTNEKGKEKELAVHNGEDGQPRRSGIVTGAYRASVLLGKRS